MSASVSTEGTPRSLARALNPSSNSLNALRLILAVFVIISHTWPVAGYGADPGLNSEENLGAWAVAGFFALSGYLIVSSRTRSRGLGDFLWRRVLRIYPAFLVALLVVAFILAPLSLLVDPTATWSIRAAIDYVGPNLGLYAFEQNVQGTLRNVPHPEVWNASLWTLAFEFACYLVAGALGTVLRDRRPQTVAWCVIAATCTAVMMAHVSRGVLDDGVVLRMSRLLACFAAGALLFLLSRRVPVRGFLALLAGIATLLLAVTGWFQALGALPAAYLLLYLGVRLPLRRIGAKNDFSYGMYIYAFPVQQMLVLLIGALALPPLVFALIAGLVTVPFAALSWRFIERPAMRWKRLVALKPVDAEGHVIDHAGTVVRDVTI